MEMGRIFRAYDIRGIYPDELDGALAYRIGQAYATLTNAEEIFIGRDSRLTGPLLLNAFASGSMSAGLSLIDVGLVNTPLIYWLTSKNPTTEGVMVTASHNPPEYNGFKISYRGRAYSYETFFVNVEEAISRGPIKSTSWDHVGSLKHDSPIRDYEEDLLSKIGRLERGLKIVVDAGNGSCGFAASLLKELGAQVVGIYLNPDGRFPHHIPDPLRLEAYTDIDDVVVREGADMGVLFDGDCDRVGFVDDRGRPLSGDVATMMLAEDVLSKRPGSKIVLNVLLSRAVFEYIKRLGGKPVMVRVGHSYIQDAMEKEEAPYAGEISGHFYFADDYYGFDDAIYAALRMSRILSRSEDRLSDLVDRLPRYRSIPERRIHCPDDIKFDVVEKLKGKYEREGLRMMNIDGVRVEVEGGWWLVRASNTEPALVMRAEADDERSLEELVRKMEKDVMEAMERSRA